MTYTLDLHFAGGDVNKGQLPGSVAYITLANYSQDESGRIDVSHQCVGPTELDAEIGRLKAELDEIGRDGRRKFEHYRNSMARIRSRVSARSRQTSRVPPATLYADLPASFSVSTRVES